MGAVPKFLGIGLNYRDHAEETGMPIPEVPIVFAKASSCVSGPNDPVLAPRDFKRMDYEVELGVVIGTRAKNVSEAEALDSCRRLRDLQRHLRAQPAEGRPRRMDQGQELRHLRTARSLGSSPPTKSPTRIARPRARSQRRAHADRIDRDDDLQRGRARELYQQIHDARCRATSSPRARRPASAWRANPRVFLKPGDEVRATISGLGEQRFKIVAEA